MHFVYCSWCYSCCMNLLSAVSSACSGHQPGDSLFPFKCMDVFYFIFGCVSVFALLFMCLLLFLIASNAHETVCLQYLSYITIFYCIFFSFVVSMLYLCMQKFFSFIVRDSLINVGPLKDFSYGLRINADPNAAGIAKQSNYELVSLIIIGFFSLFITLRMHYNALVSFSQ